MKPQFLVGALMPGSGQTLVALGLMRALRNRGLHVQSFKCGPELAELRYHALATDHEPSNLDAWMASHTHLQTLYNGYGEKADVCLVEGKGGLFDGFRKAQGSGAELARLMRIPVVLVVSARNAGYSTAAMLQGFKHFYTDLKIAGVIFNQVTSAAQYGFLRETCAEAGVECLGYLPLLEDAGLPPRHQALTLPLRKSLDQLFNKVAEQLEQHIDLSKLLNLCTRIFPCAYSLPYISETETEAWIGARKLRIALASDPAFPFLYRRSIDRMQGEIIRFSPVFGSELPQADIVYLPGGYPELFARQLHRRKRLMEQLRAYVENGGKLLAEGGGMALLGQTLTARPGGTAYEMAGILPYSICVKDNRPCSGYRQTSYRELKLKGYEYRYFDIVPTEEAASLQTPVCHAKGGEMPGSYFFRYKNCIATSVHNYWGETGLYKLWE